MEVLYYGYWFHRFRIKIEPVDIHILINISLLDI